MPDPTPIWLTPTMSMRRLANLETLSLDYLEILPRAIRTPVTHENDEILYLLDGELELTIGTTTQTLIAGEAAAIPRGTTHGSINRSGRTVRMLAVDSPAFRVDGETESPPTRTVS